MNQADADVSNHEEHRDTQPPRKRAKRQSTNKGPKRAFYASYKHADPRLPDSQKNEPHAGMIRPHYAKLLASPPLADEPWWLTFEVPVDKLPLHVRKVIDEIPDDEDDKDV